MKVVRNHAPLLYCIFHTYKLFPIDSVSECGTGPLDSESRDPVPDLENQSLEVQYRIPRQPYEDCLGVRQYIESY